MTFKLKAKTAKPGITVAKIYTAFFIYHPSAHSHQAMQVLIYNDLATWAIYDLNLFSPVE